MPIGFSGIAAAALGAGAIGAIGATTAADTQANAARNATASQMQMFNTLNDQNAPYRTAGSAALGNLSDLLGLNVPTGQITGTAGHWSRPGQGLQDFWVPDQPKTYEDFYNQALEQGSVQGIGRNATDWAKQQADQKFSAFQQANPNAGAAPGATSGTSGTGALLRPFTAADLNANLAPNYQFQLEQGEGQVQNMANKTGGLMSGNTLRAINDYAQGTAGNAYQQAFQNYNTNQNNIFTRLSNIANLGQQANQTSANVGTATAAGTASTIANQGASTAAGQVGVANALAGGLNNAGTWYAISNLLGKGNQQQPALTGEGIG